MSLCRKTRQRLTDRTHSCDPISNRPIQSQTAGALDRWNQDKCRVRFDALVPPHPAQDLGMLAKITYPSYVATISYNRPYAATMCIERRSPAACFLMGIVSSSIYCTMRTSNHINCANGTPEHGKSIFATLLSEICLSKASTLLRKCVSAKSSSAVTRRSSAMLSAVCFDHTRTRGRVSSEHSARLVRLGSV